MNENEMKSLEVYKEKFEKDPSSFNEFQANDFIKLLKTNNELDEAIEVAKTFMSQSPELKDYLNQYGYALYNKYINIPNDQIKEKETVFFDIVEEILSTCRQERYSPFEPTINRIIKYAQSKDPVDYSLIIKYCDKLDPQYISSTPFKNDEGKEFESRKERYYRILSRAYFETKNNNECIETVNKAFASNLEFHYNTAQWLRYYRACSLVEKGEYEEAKREFLKLHNRIKGVNFYEVIYKLNSKLGDIKQANIYLIYEFFKTAFPNNNYDLYERLLQATKQTSNDDLIKVVSSFIKKLSTDNNKECNEEVSDEYKEVSTIDLYDKMFFMIMDHLDLYLERKTGKVVYYNENRKFGNIGVYDQDNLFFRQEDYIEDEEVYVKDLVEYSVLETYDRKKDQITTRAILLKTLEDDLPTFNY
ncbi:MAG: hypothetical protein PHH04_08250 [Thomasclavelia sp.]|nr:hypothetical protein [Thomasclavelia sp.]